MIADLEDVARKGWREWTDTEPSIISWDFVQGDTSISAFATPKGENSPRVVVKVARSRDFNDLVSNEHHRLRELHDMAGAALPHPRTLALTRLSDGRAAHVSSFCEGSSLEDRLVGFPRRPGSVLRAGASWLGRMHSLTHRDGREPARGRSTLEHAVLHLVKVGCDLSSPHISRLIDLEADSTATSTVLVHGDYWPGNCLRLDGRRVVVVDWETAERTHDASLDVYLFPIAAARIVEAPAEPREWAGRVARRIGHRRQRRLNRYIESYESAAREIRWRILDRDEGLLATTLIMAARADRTLGPSHKETMFWFALLDELVDGSSGRS